MCTESSRRLVVVWWCFPADIAGGALGFGACGEQRLFLGNRLVGPGQDCQTASHSKLAGHS